MSVAGKTENKPEDEKGSRVKAADSQKGHLEAESPSSGHFMAYFVTAILFVVVGYIVYHNRSKVRKCYALFYLCARFALSFWRTCWREEVVDLVAEGDPAPQNTNPYKRTLKKLCHLTLKNQIQDKVNTFFEYCPS